MSFWKVLGGVAAGVGAVACLPVAGPIGAIVSVGAAVAAGTIGGAAGVAVALNDEEREEDLKKTKANEEKLKAKIIAQEKKFTLQYEEQAKRFKDQADYFHLTVALFAMGVAAANADGVICEEESEALDDFILGIAASEFPEEIKSLIAKLRKNPPNLTTAMKIAKSTPNVNWKLFESVIEMIIESDGKLEEAERAFLQAFRIKIAA